MKKYFFILIILFLSTTSYFNMFVKASELPISGAGTKYSNINQTNVQPPILSVFPNCYRNGEEWVCKQKSKVNFKHRDKKNSKSDDYYTDYIGNEQIYIQNNTIYNISPNCYYDGITSVCTHKSKTTYSSKKGK